MISYRPKMRLLLLFYEHYRVIKIGLGRLFISLCAVENKAAIEKVQRQDSTTSKTSRYSTSLQTQVRA